jgi:serine protease Do
VGDVITAVNGKPPSDERAFLRLIATAPVGQKLALHLWRDGKPQDVEVVVKEWPRDQWDLIDAPVSTAIVHHHVAPDLGLALGPLDAASRMNAGVTAGRPGVLITGVAPGSDAAQRGIVAGDVLLRVQDTDVSAPAAANAALAKVRESRHEFVLLLIEPKVHRTPGSEWKVLRLADD